MIDIHASWGHYLDHLLPVWASMPEAMRGDVLVEGQARHHPDLDAVNATRWQGKRVQAPKRVLVAGISDVRPMVRAGYGVALLEHGAGQCYVDQPGHPSYPGGLRRERVGLFLCTNESVAERNRQAYGPRAVVTGSPRLDELADARATRVARKGDRWPVLALAWHWPCSVAAESYWLLPEYRAALPDLVRLWPGKVIGHAHPKARQAPEWYRSAGVEWVPAWTDVVERADVLSFDNTSVGLEAAALGIPVVLCESTRWRHDVEHGLRFWQWAGIGPTVVNDTHPVALAQRWADAALAAYAQVEPAWTRERERMAAEVYPHRGQACWLAVQALAAWVGYSGSLTE